MGESKRRRAARDFYSQPKGEALGDAPVEEEYHDRMVAIVKGLDQVFNGDKRGPDKTVGFVLMTFSLGDGPGRCNYMSNGVSRQDVVTLMKEMITRFEGMPDMTTGSRA